MAESNLYLSRGVSSSKSEIHQAIKRIDPGIFPGAFCKVLPDTLTGDPDYCLLMHADGAGTKSSLAYIYWRETGDISIFKGIAIDSLVMNMDDLACVGSVDRFLLSNTIGRNKFLVSGDVVQTLIEGFNTTLEKMRRFGVRIDFSGGETADVGDLVRTLIVDSTLTSRLKRSAVIDLDSITVGDCVIGFASFGKCLWEDEYNSGIGSNGLTAARHDCLSNVYAEKYPESFSAEIPSELVYRGEGLLEDPLDGTPLTLGKALLSPTRTYTPLIQEILRQLPNDVHGIIHNTGGGQTKCLKFGQRIHYVKDNLFPLPPIFSHIQKTGNFRLSELYPVYNMGHRLELFIDEKHEPQVSDIAKDFGIESRVIGHCEPSQTEKNELTIKHNGETLTY